MEQLDGTMRTELASVLEQFSKVIADQQQHIREQARRIAILEEQRRLDALARFASKADRIAQLHPAQLELLALEPGLTVTELDAALGFAKDSTGSNTAGLIFLSALLVIAFAMAVAIRLKSTRTVTDAALMMAVLSQPDARDHMSLPPATIDWLNLQRDMKGLRIGLLMDAGCGMPVDTQVVDAVNAAARLFEAAGAVVEPQRQRGTEPCPVQLFQRLQLCAARDWVFEHWAQGFAQQHRSHR